MRPDSRGPGIATLRDEDDVARRICDETGLSKGDALAYLVILKEGSTKASSKSPGIKRLEGLGMLILSGDGKRYIPVHPRLAIANSYRTWREKMVREINDRRMRVDMLILELIPLYEAATEKRMNKGGQITGLD